GHEGPVVSFSPETKGGFNTREVTVFKHELSRIPVSDSILTSAHSVEKGGGDAPLSNGVSSKPFLLVMPEKGPRQVRGF
ncbi:MAG: hypothetical protein WCB20_14520, partial [Chthoniobacterales bacterium]